MQAPTTPARAARHRKRPPCSLLSELACPSRHARCKVLGGQQVANLAFRTNQVPPEEEAKAALVAAGNDQTLPSYARCLAPTPRVCAELHSPQPWLPPTPLETQPDTEAGLGRFAMSAPRSKRRKPKISNWMPCVLVQSLMTHGNATYPRRANTLALRSSCSATKGRQR